MWAHVDLREEGHKGADKQLWAVLAAEEQLPGFARLHANLTIMW